MQCLSLDIKLSLIYQQGLDVGGASKVRPMMVLPMTRRAKLHGDLGCKGAAVITVQ